MGIDPVTHKPISHLLAEIATTWAPPQAAHLAEAALGCFKDEMLHLLTKKRVDFQLQQANNVPPGSSTGTYIHGEQNEKDGTVENIKLGLARAIQQPDLISPYKPWSSTDAAGTSNCFPASTSGFQYAPLSFGNEGMGRHGARVYVLEARAQQENNRANCMKSSKKLKRSYQRVEKR